LLFTHYLRSQAGKDACAPRAGKDACAPRAGKDACAPRAGKDACAPGLPGLLLQILIEPFNRHLDRLLALIARSIVTIKKKTLIEDYEIIVSMLTPKTGERSACLSHRFSSSQGD
jgi:hypothetical protein